MEQIRIIVSGLVQGKGFRYFVLDNARELGVTGWVRNLPAGRQGTEDNKVEALLQGDNESIKKLIELCRKGPAMAKVSGIEEFSSAEPKYQNFVVRKP